jgi:RNA polymerase sigma-70 factor (ECF subfamily)
MDLVLDAVMFEKLGGEAESPHRNGGGESGAPAHSPALDPAAAAAMDEDALLMLEVKGGDTQAFSTLVLRYKDSIYSLAVKMLGDTADAEDIAQQVFIRVWHSAERYEVRSKFTTWLFTIARNLIHNESRRRRRHPARSLDAQRDDATPEIAEPADTRARGPQADLLEAELVAAVDAAIARLPENQRAAILLWRFQQMPYEEIAQVLGQSVPAVKSLLFRARTFLKAELKGYMEG